MADPLARIESLYHAAMLRPSGERTAFVAEASGGDEDLRREVESLLAEHAATDGFVIEAAPETPTLPAGTRIGAYQIVAPIGAGAMGEVYRARDTTLQRDVAIKILPQHFGADPERRARFAREARLLASLNHPNIAIIHGIEDGPDIHALVLELVTGPTLAERLERGPIAPRDALKLARQIASALEAAHAKGIVHRDLKPDNVKLSADGVVKVLDFGLAAIAQPETGADATSRGRVTVDGAILGTPAYMSPEQARGTAVDGQSDIWAFGCVLYEMLTRRRAFEAATLTDTIAQILAGEPDWTQLPHATPTAVARLLRRCLEREPAERLHDIADVRLAIDDELAAGPDRAAPARASRSAAWIAGGALAALLLAGSALGGRYLRVTPSPPFEFTIPPPENAYYSSLAMSPDGTQLAFVANVDGVTTLWVRPLAAAAARSLPATDGARFPFWSPDSRSIGFFAGGKLKRIELAGGPPVPLCDAPSGSGGTWNRAGLIVFAPARDGPLQRVAATGGQPAAASSLGGNVTAHRWPWFLPDATHFLYASITPQGQVLEIGSIDSDATESIAGIQSPAIFSGGALLYERAGSLVGQDFDPSARTLRGEPFLVAESIGLMNTSFYPFFPASTTGVLAYKHLGRGTLSQLTWVDRTGRPVATAGEPGNFINVGLSRDGRRAAASIGRGTPPNIDIWLFDLDRPGWTSHLTTDPAHENDPIWSPDSTWVLFNSNRLGTPFTLFRRSADGTGDDEPVFKSPMSAYAPDWSRDGQFVAFASNSSLTGADLWVVKMAGERVPFPFLQTRFNEVNPAFSPDGHWIAYDSDALGRSEVFVRPFPASDGDRPFQVSDGGGFAPRWRKDGRELFFVGLDGTVMSVAIDLSKAARQRPQRLFPTDIRRGENFHRYDVSEDGTRFLLPVAVEKFVPQPIAVTTNWRATLPR